MPNSSSNRLLSITYLAESHTGTPESRLGFARRGLDYIWVVWYKEVIPRCRHSRTSLEMAARYRHTVNRNSCDFPRDLIVYIWRDLIDCPLQVKLLFFYIYNYIKNILPLYLYIKLYFPNWVALMSLWVCYEVELSFNIILPYIGWMCRRLSPNMSGEITYLFRIRHCNKSTVIFTKWPI